MLTTDEPTVRITADQARVLIDAIDIAVRMADASNLRPWNDYAPDQYDDKSDRLGWFGLLEDAREALAGHAGDEETVD